MRRSFRGCSRGLALVLLASVVSPAHTAPLDATRITLKNGMRVVLAPDSFATAVDVAVWFASGSRHEKQPAQAGLALLAARLGFRNGASDPLAPLANEGGTGALVATPDLTSFSATVPPAAFARALAFLADRMPGNAVTASDLAAERAALKAERTRSDRPPVARALARLWAMAWPGHPYAKTGAEPSLGADAITPADVDAWRRARFPVSSSTLTMAGAFDPASALAAIRERFESQPRVAAPAVPGAIVPHVAGRSIDRVEIPVRLCLVGWRGPGAGDPDAPALEFLAAWLGGGPQARLSRSLVSDWHLAAAAQAGFTAQKDGSLLWALLVVPPGADSAAVETALLDVTRSLAKNAPDASELERARRGLEVGALFSGQTARQRSQALGEAEMLGGDATLAARRLDVFEKLTGEDLRRVASRVMNDAARAVVWTLPIDTGGKR